MPGPGQRRAARAVRMRRVAGGLAGAAWGRPLRALLAAWAIAARLIAPISPANHGVPRGTTTCIPPNVRRSNSGYMARKRRKVRSSRPERSGLDPEARYVAISGSAPRRQSLSLTAAGECVPERHSPIARSTPGLPHPDRGPKSSPVATSGAVVPAGPVTRVRVAGCGFGVSSRRGFSPGWSRPGGR